MGLDQLPKKMKAVQVVEFDKPYQLREVDVPQKLGPLDLLVKVAVAVRISKMRELIEHNLIKH